MSKKITSYAEFIKVCKSAGIWYIGSFMTDFLENRYLWSNPQTKGQFINYMITNYDFGDSPSSTITRINCVIRIIESGYVMEALDKVLETNDKKIGCKESKINAQFCKEKILNGEYKL